MKLPRKPGELSQEEAFKMVTTFPKIDCGRMTAKCKALCCHVVPMERDRFERNKHRLVNKNYVDVDMGKKVVETGEEKEIMLPLTEDLRCPFNDTENGYRCNIYDDRPHICKIYGNGVASCTSCPFFKANGAKRGKEERDALVRMMEEDFEEVAGKIDAEITNIQTTHGKRK